jgi:hypothetical protein
MYYALFNRHGKQIRKRMKTTDPALARRGAHARLRAWTPPGREPAILGLARPIVLAQASKPAVAKPSFGSQVSKPPCRGLSKTDANVYAPR